MVRLLPGGPPSPSPSFMTRSIVEPFARAVVVSVVMPVYNHKRYVIDAIESVRQQTFEEWELIVIDDGSTDGTQELLNAYIAQINEPRISLLFQANVGSHATLNRAIELAKAPYIAILNSDDRYHPERLSTLVRFAVAFDNLVFVVTGVQLIDREGAMADTKHWWQQMYQDIESEWVKSQGQSDCWVSTLLWGNFTVSTSNFFFSRALWSSVGPFRPLRYVPDWDFALRVGRLHPDACVFLHDQPLLDYRLHGENTILGGALKNHAEAYSVLRRFQRQWIAQGGALSTKAVDRLHYLARFIRHEHTRGMLEKQKTGWVEQVEALLAEIKSLKYEATQRDLSLSQLQEDISLQRAEAERLLAEVSVARARTSHLEIQLQQQETHAHQQIEQYRALVDALRGSTSWRLTRPLRALALAMGSIRASVKTLARRLRARVRKQSVQALEGYAVWLRDEATAHRTNKGSVQNGPVISVVMPVHNTPIEFLASAVNSVMRQTYLKWELCICDDASTDPQTLNYLAQLSRSDRRVRLARLEQPGHIVVASNRALAQCTGEYVVFLDHDDELAPQALMRLAHTVIQNPEVGLIYSDEDKLDERGNRCLPFFKPDWSPALIWSQNYIGHVMCIRRQDIEDLGGFRSGSQGSQDHDLVMRLAAKKVQIVHVPEVLYHWRMHSASTASSPNAKPYAHTAGKEAVARHLKLIYADQFDDVQDAGYDFVYQPRFKVPAATLATIIIPTRDHASMLKDCIESILQNTTDIKFEIIILDNGSVEEETFTYFESLKGVPSVRVVGADMPFNWSRLNNLGRQHALGQVLVFLNNDTVVISADWLRRLSEYALLPDVGTVGPMLLYPDETIQHAGVVVGMGGWADHVFKGDSVVHYPSPFVSSVLPRNVLANTGACVAISVHCFDELGGFDEAFEICGSDVELGIRAHNRGFQNVYLPTVRLYHLESKTRTAHVPQNDFEQSSLKYAPYRTEGDPFYNKNLDSQLTHPTPKFPW